MNAVEVSGDVSQLILLRSQYWRDQGNYGSSNELELLA